MKREQLTEFVLTSKPKVETAGEVELGGMYPKNRYIPYAEGIGFKGGLLAKIGKAAIIGARIEYEKYPTVDGLGYYSRFFFEGLVEVKPKENTPGDELKNGSLADDTKSGNSGSPDPNKPQVKTGPATAFQGSGKFGGYVRVEVIKEPESKTLNAAFGVHGKVSSYGLAVYGEYYKSGDKWHLFIGVPDNRIKLTYDKEIENQKPTNSEELSSGFGLMITAYYMVGNSEFMPTRPPPPYSENDTRGPLLQQAYMKALAAGSARNIFGSDAVNAGNAFAFGAHFGIDVWLTFGPLALDAGADIGLDVLFSRNTPNCNLGVSGEETGVNGWYLNGQFYAAISAKVGLRFKKKLFEVFNAGVALVLQAGAFNPTAGVGTWAIQYKILLSKVKPMVFSNLEHLAVMDHSLSIQNKLYTNQTD